MALATKRNNSRRFSIWDRLFPPRIRENKCSECGRPYLEHPDREPAYRISYGNVEALVYEHSKALGGSNSLIRLGVWKSSDDGFKFCQMFEEHDLQSLFCVVAEAYEINKVNKKVQSKGTVEKMSSRRSSTKKPTEVYGKK